MIQCPAGASECFCCMFSKRASAQELLMKVWCRNRHHWVPPCLSLSLSSTEPSDSPDKLKAKVHEVWQLYITLTLCFACFCQSRLFARPTVQYTLILTYCKIHDKFFLWCNVLCYFCWTDLPYMAPLLLLFILFGIVFFCVLFNYTSIHWNENELAL